MKASNNFLLDFGVQVTLIWRSYLDGIDDVAHAIIVWQPVPKVIQVASSSLLAGCEVVLINPSEAKGRDAVARRQRLPQGKGAKEGYPRGCRTYEPSPLR